MDGTLLNETSYYMKHDMFLIGMIPFKLKEDHNIRFKSSQICIVFLLNYFMQLGTCNFKN